MKRRTVIITISLVILVALGIGLIAGAVSAFNPQPEPPGRVANKLNEIDNQLKILQDQLLRLGPSITESNFRQLDQVGDQATILSNIAHEIGR
jgi:apolipoprotein N-acyltransferase